MFLGPSGDLFRSVRISVLVVVAACAVATFAQSDPAVVGQWSSVQTWPSRAVSAHLLPTGKVLFVSYYVESKTPQIWDPATNEFTPTPPISYDLFCAGHSFLPDGRLLFTGGHHGDYIGWPYASVYDPFTNTWSPGPDMNAGRWYPTNTTLSNGDILVTTGDIDSQTSVNTLPQIWQSASGTWQNLNTALLALPLYPRMFLAPNGKVFNAGQDRLTRYLDTSGTGSWTTVANTNFKSWRTYGSAVMYDTGKVLIVGGGGPPTNTAEIIDLNSATPSWKLTGSLSVARRQNNATVLPDGTVLVTGGSSGSGFDDSTLPVLTPEKWDPATGLFTAMALSTVYRGYHSTALLLPDGRVLSAGGNTGGPSAEIYSPPYLFKGPRPTIGSVPATIGYGQTVFLNSPDAANIAQVSFIRLGSVTHSFDMNARFMRLSFIPAANGLNVSTPSGPNIAPPGHYMMFILFANGVPSVGSIVQIGPNLGPPPVGSISGNVKDSQGLAIASATVSYSGGTATSDDSGNYTLPNVKTGSVQLTASATGSQNSTQTVTVAGGAQATQNFVLQPVAPPGPTGSISGNVTSSAGSALAGAMVSYSAGSTVTDSGGNYTLTNVPAGSASLTASLSGYQSSTQTVTVVADTTSSANFTLTPNPPPPPPTSGTVSGRVTKISNATAIAGATVLYSGGSALTNSTGDYSLASVAAGTYTFTASANGYLSRTGPATVTSGANSVLNLQLTTAGKLRGTVTSSTGAAVSGVAIKISGGAIATTVTLTTDTSGNYLTNWIPSGNYTIIASKTGRTTQTKTGSITSGATTTVSFTSF
jgi:hypothetical protein